MRKTPPTVTLDIPDAFLLSRAQSRQGAHAGRRWRITVRSSACGYCARLRVWIDGVAVYSEELRVTLRGKPWARLWILAEAAANAAIEELLTEGAQ